MIVLIFNWGCGTSYSSKYLDYVMRNSSQKESENLKKEIDRLQQEVEKLQKLRQQNALLDDKNNILYLREVNESKKLLREIKLWQERIEDLIMQLRMQKGSPQFQSNIGKPSEALQKIIHREKLSLLQQDVPLNKRLYTLGEIAKGFSLTAKEVVVFLQGLELRKEVANFAQYSVSQLEEQSETARQTAKKAYEMSGLLKHNPQDPELKERASQIVKEAEEIAETIYINIGVVFFGLNEAEEKVQSYDNMIFVIHHGQKMCMFLNRQQGQSEYGCLLSLEPGWVKVSLSYPLLYQCPEGYTQQEEKQCPMDYKQGVFRPTLN